MTEQTTLCQLGSGAMVLPSAASTERCHLRCMAEAVSLMLGQMVLRLFQLPTGCVNANSLGYDKNKVLFLTATDEHTLHALLELFVCYNLMSKALPNPR